MTKTNKVNHMKDDTDKAIAINATAVAPRPFVKWVGGKRQLLPVLIAATPANFSHYFEPFVGGGAFFFYLSKEKATISDANPELINCYETIRDDVDALISNLKNYVNDEASFYVTRALDLTKMTKVERAGRFIYLNKTCFNGLYRENKSGQFNTPYGRYSNPNIADQENLLAISSYLNNNDINIYHRSYKSVLKEAKAGDFVYLDPPYAPLTKTASFSSYVKGGFGHEDQVELAKMCVELSDKGVYFMQSNANVDTIHSLYGNFNIEIVHAARSISCKTVGRGKAANEVLITNY